MGRELEQAFHKQGIRMSRDRGSRITIRELHPQTLHPPGNRQEPVSIRGALRISRAAVATQVLWR